MIELFSLHVRDRGDFEVYVIQFQAFGDTPDFMSVEITRDEAESLDSVVEKGRQMVLTLLRELTGQFES